MTGRISNFSQKAVLVFLVVVLLSGFAAAQEFEQIENMNFREADIRDVLETISEVAQVNLVIDGSVDGIITIRLHEVTFEQALDMVTKSHGIDYIRDGDIVIVATPERIEDVYTRDVIEVLPLEDVNIEDAREVLSSIFPEIVLEKNSAETQMVLAGGEEDIERAISLLAQLDFSKEADEYIDIIKLDQADLEQMVSVVEGLFPELTVIANQQQKQLIVQGRGLTIDEARELITEMDVSREEQVIEIVEVNVDDLDAIVDIALGINPDVDIHIHPGGNHLIINGSQPNVVETIELIERLDVEEDRVSDRPDDSDDERIVRIIEVQELSVSNLSQIISSMYPELNVEQSPENNRIILQGSESYINLALELVEELDMIPEPAEPEVDVSDPDDVDPDPDVDVEPEEVAVSPVEVMYRDVEEVGKYVRDTVQGVEVTIDTVEDQLYISGPVEVVQSAVERAREFDREMREVTEVVAIDFLELDIAEDILSGTFSEDLSIQQNEQLFQMVLKGYASEVDQALDLLQQVDSPRDQVMIEARVVDIDVEKTKDVGFNPNLDNINFLMGDSFNLTEFLNLAESENFSETIARPSLMTLSGEDARMLVGERITVPIIDQNTGEIIDTETFEAGINLDFAPRVAGDQVTLEVKPEVSSFTGTGRIRDIQTSETQTTIRLKDGETFAIGGLIRDDDDDNIREVPYLSRLPVLGELFKTRAEENRRRELVIAITVHILGEGGLEDIELKYDDDREYTGNGDNSEEIETSSGIEVIEDEEKKYAEAKNQPENDLEHEFSGNYYDYVDGE